MNIYCPKCENEIDYSFKKHFETNYKTIKCRKCQASLNIIKKPISLIIEILLLFIIWFFYILFREHGFGWWIQFPIYILAIILFLLYETKVLTTYVVSSQKVRKNIK